MIRPLKHLSLFLALPLAIITTLAAAIIAWIIATESGTHWLLTRAAGDKIHFDSLKGTLAEGVQLRQLSIKSSQMRIDIGSIDSRWTLWSILGGQLTIDSIAADSIAIEIYDDDSPANDNSNPWPGLQLPLPINIGNLSLSRLSISSTSAAKGDNGQNQAAIEITSINLKAIINPLQTHIQAFSLVSPDGEIEIAGRIGNQFPYSLSLKTAWKTTAVEEKLFSGAATLSGAVTKLNVNHQLNSPFLLTTEGTLVIATSDREPLNVAAITADIRSRWQDINIAALVSGNSRDELAAINSSGSLALTGSAAQYQLEGDTRLLALTTLENSSQLLQQLAQLDISIAIEGNLRGATISALSLESDQGSALVSGTADWQQGLNWQIEIQADNLDTRVFLRDLPGIISANIDSDGSWRNNQLQTQIHITELDGRLSNHQFHGRGKVAINKSPSSLSAQITDLALTLGANEFFADGVIGDTSAVNWQLNGADLSALGDGFSGSLVGAGSFKGNVNDLINLTAQGGGVAAKTLSSLAITADIEGDKIKIPSASVDHISVLATRNDVGQHQLSATTTGLSAAGIADADIQLATKGTVEQHHFSLAFDDNSNHLRLAGNGGYLDQGWRANISRLNIDNVLAGAWLLENSATVTLTPATVEVGQFCLRQDSSSACATANYAKGEIDTSGQLRDIDLSRLKPWLPATTEIKGSIGGEFSVAGNTANLDQLRVKYQLNSVDGTLGYELEDNQRIDQNFGFVIAGASDGKTIDNNARLTIGDMGQIDLDVALGFADGWPVRGHLSGHLDSLQWLQAITTAVEKPEGNIALNAMISGSLHAPEIEGELQLNAISATLPALGIKLNNGSGQLLLDRGNHWQLDTSIASGENRLSINGEGMFARGTDNLARLHIQGDNLSLVDLPNTKASFSPNLDIILSSSALTVSGRLGVPRARLVIKPEPEGITSVSKDEVIAATEQPQKNSFAFKTDILLALGDDVRLDAYGLSTGVTGELNLVQKKAGLPSARGTLSLHKGSYEAYGQKLDISQGFLIFQGAVDNPGLNIIASRKTAMATVGVKIGGTAQNIKSSVFSDPALPATETLTLLITGKLPTNLNQSDTNQVANAAAALGISQSDWITNRLQSSLGLDVVSLKGGDSYMDSSLVVGKYLSSKLFVSYIQNLFSPQGSFALQYQIGDKLGLKAESGETQSIDLLYRIEH